MDVWVLVREWGVYSDYVLEVVGVASSSAEAMRLGNEMHRSEYDEESTDKDDPPAPFVPLTWEEHPQRSGDWHTTADIVRDPYVERYCAVCTALDQFMPDKRYGGRFEARSPGW